MKNEINLATSKGIRKTIPKRVFEMTFNNEQYKFAIVEFPLTYLNNEEEMLIVRSIHFNSGRLLPISPPNRGVSIKNYIEIVKKEIDLVFNHYGAEKFKQEFSKYESINQ